ncbi:MAG: hypothetical protein IJ571_08550 [Ruminococcus sp.]|nr:hypothetical protein [Ruminococcus sp.]
MTVEQIIENNKKTVEAIKSYHQTKYPYTFAICRAMGDDNDNCSTVCPLCALCKVGDDEDMENEARKLVLSGSITV